MLSCCHPAREPVRTIRHGDLIDQLGTAVGSESVDASVRQA
jgi:hypothetical protein